MVVILTGCVQKTHQKTIQFKLDMTKVENPENVGVRGEFGSKPWNETIYFTDDDADGIFEGTVIKQTGQGGIEFKFVNHNDVFELPGQNNRVIEFKYQTETILYDATFNNPEGKTSIIKPNKK
jgi:hypothetical protein